MPPCEHIAWLQIAGTKSFSFGDCGGLKRIISQLTDPSSQTPALLFFIGKKAKNTALRQLFPFNNIKRARSPGIASLRIDTATLSSNNPLIFADDSLSTVFPQRLISTLCHETVSIPVRWSGSTCRTALDIVYSRLFFLFCNVICIFADDFQSLDDITTQLSTWASIGKSSGLPSAVRPRVLIVASPTTLINDQIIMEDFRFKLRGLSHLNEVFSSITIMHLGSVNLSSLARHRQLREVLLRQSEEMQEIRHNHHVLFSAVHLQAFYQEALLHTARTATEPFDFVCASRKDNPIDDHYVEHISVFLRLTSHYKYSYNSLALFLASTMIVDAYPPGMHGFDSELVFQAIYKPVCHQALVKCDNSTAFADSQCHHIGYHFQRLFSTLDSGICSSTELHSENMKSDSLQWIRLKTSRTCLYCLRRKPEHVLTCGHAICDICVKRFGRAINGTEYHYQIAPCILCSSQGSLTVKLKPPSSGARILCVDGGGTRGVIPLENLTLLQSMLGSELPLQDFFDLAFGTSSGGLIVLTLFVRRWDAHYCSKTFDSLVHRFFGNQRMSTCSIGRLRIYLKSWLRDGRYDALAFESFLKDIFGVNKRMFDTPESTYSGTKVGVTATTISDASPFVFSNYNGSCAQKKDSGYKHLRPHDVEDEIHVWEAARATSAAPVLFRPAHIAAVGAFQDGGLKHNNPVNLALWESRRIWPENSTPDVVVSFGTGTEQEGKSPDAPHFRHVFNDGFIPRLCRSFLSTFDGESVWRELKNRLDETSKESYFRLNSALDREPVIDDVKGLSDLRRSVHIQPNGLMNRQNLIFTLLISTFFFELDCPPVYESGFYRCQGSIHCRNDSNRVLEVLARLYGSHMEFVTDTEVLATLNDSDDICSLCHRYHKALTFYVRNLTDVITIYLRGDKHRYRRVSAFPQCMHWFVQQQKLCASFGTPDHGTPGALKCHACTGSWPSDVVLPETRKRKLAQVDGLQLIKPQLKLNTHR